MDYQNFMNIVLRRQNMKMKGRKFSHQPIKNLKKLKMKRMWEEFGEPDTDTIH